MGKRKAFWLSFLYTLAVLLPLYAAVYYAKTVVIGNKAPAAASESGIGIERPTAEDSRNLLVVVKGEVSRFVLVRFDAFQSRIAVAALRPDTLLRGAKGGTVTVEGAWNYAGPGYAAQRIAETLGVEVDHYLQLSAETLISFGGKIGAVRIDAETMELAGAGGSQAGGKATALSAQNIADLLRLARLGTEAETPFISRVFALFLAAGTDRLEVLFPSLLRAGEKGLSTSILAPEIYDYTRLLGFFVQQTPAVEYAAFPGKSAEGGFELDAAAPEQAVKYFS